MTKKCFDDAFAAIHETMEALQKVDAIDKPTIRESDAACPALQELHAAIAAGANSGLGRNADAVFSRLRQKYQDATTKGVA